MYLSQEEQRCPGGSLACGPADRWASCRVGQDNPPPAPDKGCEINWGEIIAGAAVGTVVTIVVTRLMR